jgi:type II secretory pathway pseudopilin PulG
MAKISAMSDYNNSNSFYPSYQFSDEISTRFNGLEIIVVLVLLISMISVTTWGFFTGTRESQDRQKQHDIQEIMVALDYFYKQNKFYPIRQCSEDLNPIDFEFYLRQNLTGKVTSVGSENYISTSFPRDRVGEYVLRADQYLYRVPCPSVIAESVRSTGNIYSDGQNACNYNRLTTTRQGIFGSYEDSSQIRLRCYLYTSTVRGETYRLGYYSESQARFVVISKTREEPQQVNYL